MKIPTTKKEMFHNFRLAIVVGTNTIMDLVDHGPSMMEVAMVNHTPKNNLILVEGGQSP